MTLWVYGVQSLKLSQKTNKNKNMSIILGIDPGSRITGYGVIQQNGNHYRFLDCGILSATQKDFPSKLKIIFSGLQNIIQEFHPTEVAVEEVFMSRNANSAIKLGQARGCAITAAAIHDLPVGEYSPREIKQAVVGYGNASKGQIQEMVKRLLNLREVPFEDAADALAVAICHGQNAWVKNKLSVTAYK